MIRNFSATISLQQFTVTKVHKKIETSMSDSQLLSELEKLAYFILLRAFFKSELQIYTSERLNTSKENDDIFLIISQTTVKEYPCISVIIHSTFHIIIIHYTLYIVHYTFHTIHYTLYIIHST